MKTLTSSDGTTIAYEQQGSGPPLVLVDGAFCGRKFGPMPALATRLASHFTVIHYDRRGRGDSSSGPDPDPNLGRDHVVEREIEDLRALVDVLGGHAFVYGISSGAVLAARAVAAGVAADKLAIYEPPLALDDTHHPAPADFIEQLDRMIAADRRADAVKLFMRVVGVPRFGIFFMQLMPGVFKSLKAVAPTLMHDFAVLGDTQRGGPLPAELEATLRSIEVSTLALYGGKSPAWMKHAAERVAATIPDARTDVVPRQDHNVGAKAIAPVLVEFFTA